MAPPPRPRTPTPGPNAPPISVPSSPDHLCSALPPPSVSRSPTRSPSRSVGRRSRTRSPGKHQQQPANIITTTANQLSPNKFVTSTIFMPSRGISAGAGAGGVANSYAVGGGTVRLGVGEAVIPGGTEESWKIRVVVEAEREEGGRIGGGGVGVGGAQEFDMKVKEMGATATRGRGRGRGTSGMAGRSVTPKAPKVRKATPAGRGRGRARRGGVDGGEDDEEDDEDDDVPVVMVRKKRTTAAVTAMTTTAAATTRATTHISGTGRGRTRTLTTKIPVRDAESSDDEDPVDPFLEIADEEEKSIGKGKNKVPRALKPRRVITPAAAMVKDILAEKIPTEAPARRTGKVPTPRSTTTETNLTNEGSTAVVMKKTRSPAKPKAKKIESFGLASEEDEEPVKTAQASNSTIVHQTDDPDKNSEVVISKSKTTTSGVAATDSSSRITLGKRITATSTALGRLRTSTAASDAIRARRRGEVPRERNVTPRERVGSVVSLDSPTFSSPNSSAFPLLVPKTRQQSSNHPTTTTTTTTTTIPSTTPVATLNHATRQRIASNNSHQTATPPPSSPPSRRPRDYLRGCSRVSRRSKSPVVVAGSSPVVVEASGSIAGENSNKQGIGPEVEDDDDGEDSGIYWADFAADGAESSDSSDEGEGYGGSRLGKPAGEIAATNQTLKQPYSINAKASSTHNVLPGPVPTSSSSATQNQTNATTTDTIDPFCEADIDWLSSPTKHTSTQHQRSGSIASTHSNIVWPDTEEGEGEGDGEDEAGSVVHQRVSSIDSVNYFPQLDTDGGGSESQPGSVRRSSVITTNVSSGAGGKSAKPRRRIMDILPADYQSRRTLFDGVVPPRAESPEVVPSKEGGSEREGKSEKVEIEGEAIKPKRKGKRKSVGFAGAVEIPTEVPAMATSSLVNEDVTEEVDSITPTTATAAFPSSPPVPPPQQEEEQAKPQTPGNTTGIQFLPELFVPKRRYMEFVKQQVAGRRAPELARCRVASVVLQRAILGELGGRDGGGIPREFGGYLVRVDESAIVVAESSDLVKGKERAVDVEEVVELAAAAGEVGVGVGVVARTIPVPVPSVRNIPLARSTELGSVRSTSPTGEVSYPILPARRMISGLGRPTTTLTTTPITTTTLSGASSPVPPRLRKTAMATATRVYSSSTVTSVPASAIYTSASRNATTSTTTSNTTTTSASAAATITNTLAHARAFSGASGRGGGSGGSFQTPMKEKDLRASLLETLVRSRRKLGMRRSVTPPLRQPPTPLATITTTTTTTTQQAHQAGSLAVFESSKSKEKEGESESKKKGKEPERETESPENDIVIGEAEVEVDKQRDEIEAEQSGMIDVLVQEQLISEERASVEREVEKVDAVMEDTGMRRERKERSASSEKSITRDSSIAPEIIPPANVLPPGTPATELRSSRRRARVETDNLLVPPPPPARFTRSMTRSSAEDLSTPTPAPPSAEERTLPFRAGTVSTRQSKSPTPSSESLPDATPVPIRRGRGALGARGLTLEERWEAERMANVRRAREVGVVTIDDAEEESDVNDVGHVRAQREVVVVEDNQESEEMEKDISHQIEDEVGEEEDEQIENEIIVRRYTPVEEANVQRSAEADMVDEYAAESSSSSEDPEQNSPPMIFRRKGLLRTPRIAATSSMESVILHVQPTQLPHYPQANVNADEDEDVEEDMEYTVDAGGEIDYDSSSSEDSALDEPMVFPRRGLHRPGAMPAAGVHLVPSTPIRRPLGRVHAFGSTGGSGSARMRRHDMGALGMGRPAWTPRELRIGDYEEMVSESQEISYSYEETGEIEGYEEDEEGGAVEDEDLSDMEETENNDIHSPTGSAAPVATSESRPGFAARLFGNWWPGSGRPAGAEEGDAGFQELLPAELVGRVAHAHQGHDGSRGENWALNEQSTSSSMFTTSQYSRTREDHLEEEEELDSQDQEEALRQHRQVLRPATVWLPRHWELLDALMQDVSHPNAPVTPPRAAARYEIFKRNRLRELESSNPSRSSTSPPPPLVSSSQPHGSSSNHSGLEQERQDQQVQPTPITLFRVPLLNWRIKYTPYSRTSPRRQRQQSSSPQPEDHWRNDPIMELDEREMVVVDWFVQEARERFDGEDWGGREGREMVEKMVRCWGLKRERDRRGERGLAFSGVGREEKRRLYYGGLRV